MAFHDGCKGLQFARSWALALVVLILPGLATAQITSTITGTVTDKQGGAIVGAKVHVEGTSLVANFEAVTDSNGEYRLPALLAGVYKMEVTRDGFRTAVFERLDVELNKVLRYDITMDVGSAREQVEVTGQLPLLETQTSAQETSITPQDIENIPLNGRNYLDLLQMVPGVGIFRQADSNTDNAVPVLGERGNNTSFLIDGLANRNEVNGGAAAQFNQDTIAEFQVITTGYTADFGHASGGVVNVISKSGSNDVHGVASVYHRNSVFDTSDTDADVPKLLRWDYSVALGGPVIKDKVFWFASGEGIHENRQLNFTIPPNTIQSIRDSEEQYGSPSTDREVRGFGKLDEIVGHHHITEEFNYDNSHIGNFLPLLQSTSLPSTRQNYSLVSNLFGVSDTATLGDSGNPWIWNVHAEFRADRSGQGPAHPQAGPYTYFNLFSSYTTGDIFGDITPQIIYGSPTSQSSLDQQYTIAGTSFAKTWGKHTFKFGYDYERSHVDGVEASLLFDQLFATAADYDQFGPIDAGFFLLESTGGATPADSQIKLRNNYSGIYGMDDWKITKKLTLNLGLRWDYDSKFDDKTEFSPRLGFAYAFNSKTVIRGSWGYFYDHFRLGIARDVPGFGGANLTTSQPLSYPRLFSGVPTIAPALFGLCLSPTLTDAQIAAQGVTCPYIEGAPIYGIDHLNNVVAPGHAQIPINSVVNQSNIQQLSGLDPTTYLNEASVAIGQQPGYLFWGPYGALSYNISQPGAFPVTIDPRFKTPYTNGFNFGIQREVTHDFAIAVDYYHKNIDDILGVRNTNVPFDARINNSFAGPYVNGFGPWYSGKYDAGIFSFQKRMSRHFTIGGSYTFANEHDNALCSGLDSTLTGVCYPTDSYVGTPPVVVDPGIAPSPSNPAGCPGNTNAQHAFFACNGNYVPVAGKFYNGADLDSGPSDFAVTHTFQTHALIELPWGFEFATVFRAQSGFHYSQSSLAPVDQDGNNNFNGRDLTTARNAFVSPAFVNMDLRVAKTFSLGERVHVQALFEFFNLFNNANPAAMQNSQTQTPLQPGVQPFGAVSQYLPGREGQVGLRITF